MIRTFLAFQADEGSDLDAVETIVGELVANVIQHAPGAIGIHVSWDGARATMVIADRGPGIPSVRLVPDGLSTTGRGLLMIQALARHLEFESVPGYGARVTVELPVHRALVSAG
jgi:anti-sigma regulatory factor (Ser/Thr protein kinase)